MKELTKKQKQDIIDNAPEDATHLLGLDHLTAYAVFNGAYYISTDDKMPISDWNIVCVISELREELKDISDSYITKKEANEYFIKSEIDREIKEIRNTIECEYMRRYPCTKISTAVFIQLKYICSQHIALLGKGIFPDLIKPSELSKFFNH